MKRLLICLTLFLFMIVIMSSIVKSNNTQNNKIVIVTPTPEPIIEYISTPEPTKATENPIKEVVMPKYDVPLSIEIQEYTYERCKYDNKKYELVLKIMKGESNFNQNNISYNKGSKTTDYGLMQVNSSNRQWMKRDLGIALEEIKTDVYKNIDCGIYILDVGYNPNDINFTLMMYNMHPDEAKSYRRQGKVNPYVGYILNQKINILE